MGGVLLTNLSLAFWRQAEDCGHVNGEELKERFRQDLREELWTGRIGEDRFWTWLAQCLPSLPTAQARELLAANLQPLPALEQLALWSARADIHLLSNHRAEWVRPVLAPYERYIATMTVSSEVGLCKPDARIFEHVRSRFGSETALVIYVDDQSKNLPPAAALGWQTVLADSAGSWAAAVTRLLVGVDGQDGRT
ncbi:HAD-IA family hydrolase [Paenibacillus piri]|uniref:HAD-IA family hydrolase n=1 Tax=Paenibacillus piri TaxID=2547395 RepID=UPI00319D8A2D